MMIIFGGRDNKSSTCKEIWGLRKHRDGRWDWTQPKNLGNFNFIQGRYQHVSLYLGTLLINIGGKLNDTSCNGKITVYDYEVPSWYETEGVECFRHVAWIDSHYLYIHGGLDNQNRIFF